MENLENNNWIILDPLGNTYEIYANLTVMTLLNLNHFWIMQAELCLKDMFVSVANTSRSSAIADRLRTLVSKKNLEITKITNFSHTKKVFKTAKPERSFSSNFIIQLHLNSSYSFYMKPYVTTHYETSELIWLTDCGTLSFEHFYRAIKVLSFWLLSSK